MPATLKIVVLHRPLGNKELAKQQQQQQQQRKRKTCMHGIKSNKLIK